MSHIITGDTRQLTEVQSKFYNVIKINLEKALKLNFQDSFLLWFKEFHGLHDDLKTIWKKLTPGRYPVQKTYNLKKRNENIRGLNIKMYTYFVLFLGGKSSVCNNLWKFKLNLLIYFSLLKFHFRSPKGQNRQERIEVAEPGWKELPPAYEHRKRTIMPDISS